MIESKKLNTDHLEDFPALLISDSDPIIIILAVNYNQQTGNIAGTVVQCDSKYKYGIGYTSTVWNADNFSKYTGTITLKNK